MSIDYMKNEQVRLYYERWADNEHGNFVGRGREEFYKFVKDDLEHLLIEKVITKFHQVYTNSIK